MSNPQKITICVVGQGGVGKSAVSLRFISDKFLEDYDPTIEDSYRKQVLVDRKACVLDILDTAGQEMYNTYRDNYYRSAEAFLIVYSVTNHLTFVEVRDFWDAICRVKEVSTFPAVLVGNKVDLRENRKVTTDEGEELAKKYGIPFFECSAKDNTNIEEVFFQIVRQVRKNHKDLDKGDKKHGCNIL